MSRIIKSKFYKPFISLLVALILIFSFEVNRPKAILPLLVPLGYLVAGVVAEELLEMGIKHVTADGKTTKKSKAGKITDAVLDSLGDYDFDNTNPTRKADGSLEMNMSANDRAKIARMIADEFGDVIDSDTQRVEKGDYYDYGTTEINLQPHSLLAEDVMAYDFTKKMYDVFVQEGDDGLDDIIFRSVVTGVYLLDIPVTKGYEWDFRPRNFTGLTPCMDLSFRMTGTNENYGWGDKLQCDAPTVNAYKSYLAVKDLGSVIYMANGMTVPKTLRNVYRVGEGYQGQELPNTQDLSNKPYKIPNFFPPSSSDDNVEWELVRNHYENDITTNQTKFENETETYLENGDLNQNTYNTQTINNYYTDSNYPVKADDADLLVKIDIDITPPPPVVIDDDDDGSTGDLPPQAEVLDRTLISYAKQTYDYLGDSIDGAIISMRDITDDASGLVDYLDTSFRWLPAEWRALFGSAFILGVFAHFMRR